MPIYSKTFNNEEILSIIPSSCKKILIVICGGCMSESLAYDNKLPLSVLDEKGVKLPFASSIEAERISKLLLQNGYLVEFTSLSGNMPVLCVFSDEKIPFNLYDNFNPDIILTLSCPAGAFGVKKMTDKPVVAITRQLGSLAFTYKEDNGKTIIIEERSNVDVYL